MKTVVFANSLLTLGALAIALLALQRNAPTPSVADDSSLRTALDKVTADIASLRAANSATSLHAPTVTTVKTKLSTFDYPLSSPGYYLAQYLSAGTWQERLQFVKQTEGIQERMAAHYGDGPIQCAIDQLSVPDVRSIKDGDVVTVTAASHGKNVFGADITERHECYLEKSGASYVILWEPTVGWRPIGWEALKTSRPTEPVDYMLYCALADGVFANKKDIEKIKVTHHCLQIAPEADRFSDLYAFVLKESSAGKRIYETLKDGRAHGMVLTIQFEPESSESCVWVSRVVSDKCYIYDDQMAHKYTAPTPKRSFVSPVGWKPFLVSRDTRPTDFLLYCVMAESFRYSTTRDAISHTHFPIQVCPETTGLPFTAFVVRDSKAGKKIFDTLKDGEVHQMVLTVQFRDKRDEECVWITRVLSDTDHVYDDKMGKEWTAPILASNDAKRTGSTTSPFRVSDMTARWVIDENVLGGEALVVPEVRLRIEAIAEPITSLRVKVVYLEKTKNGFEILYEDTSFAVSTGDTPLSKGLSKTIISKSGKGYKRDVAAAAVSFKDVTAEIHFDIGQGYVKFDTIPVAKTLGR